MKETLKGTVTFVCGQGLSYISSSCYIFGQIHVLTPTLKGMGVSLAVILTKAQISK